jgi:hypothetical protein
LLEIMKRLGSMLVLLLLLEKRSRTSVQHVQGVLLLLLFHHNGCRRLRLLTE